MDILTYIKRMNQIYGNDTQVASSPTNVPFMAPELQEDISPMPNIPDLLREEGIKVGEQVKAPVRYNTQQYLQGGRVGYQSGQLVQPGLGRQGYAGEQSGAPLNKQFPKMEKRAIELLNEGLSLADVSRQLEKEGVIKVKSYKF